MKTFRPFITILFMVFCVAVMSAVGSNNIILQKDEKGKHNKDIPQNTGYIPISCYVEDGVIYLHSNTPLNVSASIFDATDDTVVVAFYEGTVSSNTPCAMLGDAATYLIEVTIDGITYTGVINN